MARTAKVWYFKQRDQWACWIDGRRTILATGRKNKKLAQQRLVELRFTAMHNAAAGSPQTVASVIERYEEHAKKRLAQSTLDTRLPYLQSFAEAHGFRAISDARPEHMENWLDEHPEWASDWTKNGAIRNVQVAFNWAWLKARIIKENPFRGVSHRAGASRRNVTPEEFQAILRATAGRRSKSRPSAGARFRQILVFLWRTGCRPAEASSLIWENIDLDAALITLDQHKTAKMQKTPQPRIVPLDPVVVKLLRSIERRGEGRHVFLSCRKTPWNRRSLGLRILRGRKAVGIPDEVKLYGIRHAFGTRGVTKVDLKTLSVLMGHTTTRMTEHYVHLAGQHVHLASSMRRINAPRSDA